MPPPREYINLLSAVIKCLRHDADTPLRTAEEITAWLHSVSAQDVANGLNGSGEHVLLHRMVRRLIEMTHDPRLSDWTPEQIADWSHRARLRDIQSIISGSEE